MPTSDSTGLTRAEPRHLVVARRIEEEIRCGTMRVGDRLAGELQLAEKFGVSRGTVRKALAWLAEQRLIDTRSGAGSFVTFDGHNLDVAEGWTSAMMSAGPQTTTHILRCEVIIDPELAVNVRSASLQFLALDRLRRIQDGTVVSIERSRVPAVGRLASAPSLGLVDASLTKTIRAAGLIPRRGEQWAQVTPLSPEDARLLGKAEGDCVLHTMTTTWGEDGAFVERVTSLLDPNRFRLRTAFGIA